MTTRQRSTLVLSVLLVPLWTSGFVVGKIATAHAGVISVLFWRFLIAAVVMAIAAVLAGARLPRGRQWLHLVVVALLLQVGQYVGLYTGLANGVSAGASSLIVGVAPLLVALLAPLWFPERLTPLTVFGLLLGATGVYIVLSGNVTHLGSPVGLLFTVVGTAALTAGTLYQKRFGSTVDVRTAIAVQMGLSAAVLGAAMLVAGAPATPADVTGWAAVGWLGVANSAGAFAVMYLLLRRVSTVHISSLLNLVPAVTALISVPVLGEELSVRYVIGLVVALAGMYSGLVLAGRAPRADSKAVGAAEDHRGQHEIGRRGAHRGRFRSADGVQPDVVAPSR